MIILKPKNKSDEVDLMFPYEVLKIAKALNKRGYDADLVDIQEIWCDFSASKYVSWISVEGFSEIKLVEIILEYAKKIKKK